MYNHYNKKLRKNAHELRTNSVSKAEKYIWKVLLSKKQLGVKFKRQRPIDSFVVDFYAQEINLIIEIDGSYHLHNQNYDKFREEKLRRMGYDIIRFTEGEVINNIWEVHREISHVIYCLKSKEQ